MEKSENRRFFILKNQNHKTLLYLIKQRFPGGSSGRRIDIFGQEIIKKVAEAGNRKILGKIGAFSS